MPDQTVEELKYERHDEKIDNLEAAVFGNGHDGLSKTVTRIAVQMKLVLWGVGIIAIAVIGQLVAGLAGLFK